MKQWEYDVLPYHESYHGEPRVPVIDDMKGFTEYLNRFGSEGWEAVAMLPPQEIGGGFLFAVLVKREIPESPEPPDVPKPTHVGENWTGWGKGESKCPKCGSEDTEELDASADEMTAGKRHCKSCGFEGGVFLY